MWASFGLKAKVYLLVYFEEEWLGLGLLWLDGLVDKDRDHHPTSFMFVQAADDPLPEEIGGAFVGLVPVHGVVAVLRQRDMADGKVWLQADTAQGFDFVAVASQTNLWRVMAAPAGAIDQQYRALYMLPSKPQLVCLGLSMAGKEILLCTSERELLLDKPWGPYRLPLMRGA